MNSVPKIDHNSACGQPLFSWNFSHRIQHRKDYPSMLKTQNWWKIPNCPFLYSTSHITSTSFLSDKGSFILCQHTTAIQGGQVCNTYRFRASQITNGVFLVPICYIDAHQSWDPALLTKAISFLQQVLVTLLTLDTWCSMAAWHRHGRFQIFLYKDRISGEDAIHNDAP